MIYTLSFHDHAPSPQIYFPSRRSLNVSSLLSLTKCMEQQRARSTPPREKHPVPPSRRVSNTTFTAQHSRGKTEPVPPPLSLDGGGDGGCSSQRNNSCGSGNAKSLGADFFPPLAWDTSGAALTEDTARKRGKTTKQIKQTTTVGGLAICARAWKCFVPSLFLSLSLSLVLADLVLPRRRLLLLLRAGGYFNCIFIFFLINCN